jgi:hypothetical protein
VSPGGHQQGAGAISGMVVLEIPFCTGPRESRCSGLPNRIVRFATSRNWTQPQFWSLPPCLWSCPSPLLHPLDLSPCFILFHHWPKFHPSTLSVPHCPLNHQQKPLTCEPTVCTAIPELLLSLGKPNGPVWYSRLSDFPVWGPCCSAIG